MATTPRPGLLIAGLGLVALAGLAAASCGSRSASAGSTGTPAAGAVVSGSVTAGPSCPVASSSHPCPARPLAGAVVEAIAGAGATAGGGGRVAAQARTARDGTFSLTVPAGSYQVEVRPEGPYPRCRPVAVHVAAGAHHHLTVTCDTGIR